MVVIQQVRLASPSTKRITEALWHTTKRLSVQTPAAQVNVLPVSTSKPIPVSRVSAGP